MQGMRWTCPAKAKRQDLVWQAGQPLVIDLWVPSLSLRQVSKMEIQQETTHLEGC